MKKQSKKKSDWFYLFIGAAGMMVCVVIGVAAWTAVNYPVLASMLDGAPTTSAPQQQEEYSSQVEISKPSIQPANATFPATQMAVLSSPIVTLPPPTFTLEPLPTATALPTLIPTEAPTFTPEPTETPAQLALELLVDTPTAVYIPPPTSSAPKPKVASSGNGARWIDVDLTNQAVYAYEGDVLVNSFIVSTGTWQTPTVTGKYKIYVKIRSGNMHGPGYFLPDVPYIMYFHKGYGLHGTYWHNNFGTPMSHGCVNLRTDEAGWLYNWASVGTVVNVHY